MILVLTRPVHSITFPPSVRYKPKVVVVIAFFPCILKFSRYRENPYGLSGTNQRSSLIIGLKEQNKKWQRYFRKTKLMFTAYNVGLIMPFCF